MKKVNHIQSWALFIPEIKQLIQEKNFLALKEILNEIHPTDLAEGYPQLTNEEKIIVFRLLNFNRAIALFEDLDVSDQTLLIENLETNPLEQLLENMPADEKTKLIKNLPERFKKKLINLLKKEDRYVVEQTLEYKENTAGAVMNTYFIPLFPSMTIKQAIEKIHSLSKFRKYSTLNTFYVINNEGKLLGGISLRKLIAAPSDLKVTEIMSSVNFIKVPVDTSLEEVGKKFAKYDLVIAPVVDENDKLVGVITVDDVIDIINAINTKQFYEIGKMSGEKEIKYSEITWFDLVRRRAGWLVLLLVFDFFTGSVLKHFESAIATVVALTFFIPMLLDTGGNAGSQVSITLIRSFATGDVNFKNIWRVIKVELSAAILISLIMGIIAFFRGMSLNVGSGIALVVGLTMICLIILAICISLILPIISKKMGLDPAVLAGPINTSIVDVLGLIIYFKIAQIILPQLRG
jgi:magnesium transporter